MVDRADAVSPRSVPIPPAAGRAASRIFPPLYITLPVIACLELLWLGWYLVVPLPNVQSVEVRRGLLLLKTFPEVAPGTTFRQSLMGKAVSELSHVENLPQRIPIVLVAALIGGTAVVIGDLVAGLLGVRRLLGWPSRIALDYGLGAAFLGILTLTFGRLGWLTPWTARGGLGVLAVMALVANHLLSRRAAGGSDATADLRPGRPLPASSPATAGSRDRIAAGLFGLLVAPFVAIILLGSMLPATDFDVLEYHLQGPKEWFLSGGIHYLRHNVYTNMPFDVEMLHLLGMEVMGDWWWGALSGQLLVALFVPAAAALIYSTARAISRRAGWLAALVYLSTPWIYRIGVIAYVEGPLCFYQSALVWSWLAIPPGGKEAGRRNLLMGLLAGAAMGCKYTAILSSAIPFGLIALRDACRRRSVRPALAFGLGWAIVMGPWMIKNAIDTGDPVYPLGYRVFHGRDWDEARQAQWQRVHGPRSISWGQFTASAVEVAGRSDWQSALYVALAPLALLRAGSRRTAGALWGLSAYVFLSWWLFTHRLDRFWLPILPVLAVLAGIGGDWVRHVGWTILLGLILLVCLTCNLTYDSSALAGLNEWTGDLVSLRRDLPRRLNPPLATLDARLPPDARILLVGQASVFHLDHPIVYNTVFNPETIEELARDRDAEGLRRALHERGLTHIYVDWHEIERYRQPGNYGFTPFVTPERFAGWVAAGVLEPPVPFGADQDLYRVR